MYLKQWGWCFRVFIFSALVATSYATAQDKSPCTTEAGLLGSRIKGGTGDVLKSLPIDESVTSITEAVPRAFNLYLKNNTDDNNVFPTIEKYPNSQNKVAIVISDRFSREDSYKTGKRPLKGVFFPFDDFNGLLQLNGNSHGALVLYHTMSILKALGFKAPVKTRIEGILGPVYKYTYPQHSGELIIVLSPFSESGQVSKQKVRFAPMNEVRDDLVRIQNSLKENKYTKVIFNLSWAIVPCEGDFDNETDYSNSILHPQRAFEIERLLQARHSCSGDLDCVEMFYKGAKIVLHCLNAPQNCNYRGKEATFIGASGNASKLYSFAPASWPYRNVFSVCGSSVDKPSLIYRSVKKPNVGSNVAEIMMPGWWFKAITTKDEQIYYGGTSFAAPFVTVAAALGIELSSLRKCAKPSQTR
jgi:hypothetical protein